MKKIITLVLVVVLAISICGCSAKEIVNKDLSRGVVEENVYTNEYIGFTFTKPAEWVYATDDEINELMGASAEIMDQSDYEAAVSELLSVYDMMVTDPATNNNINVVYENLKLSGSVDMSEDEYLGYIKENLSAITELTYVFGEAEKATLGGVEFTKLPCDVDYMGVISMKQNLYVKNVDGFMCSITITVVDGSDFADIEGHFAPVK